MLKEMARTMLCENNLPKYFWEKAINTSCYVINKVSIRLLLSKTPYELYKGKKSKFSHLWSFCCKCFILNNGKHLIGKMDVKSDETIFMDYALDSKAYRVFNTHHWLLKSQFMLFFMKLMLHRERVLLLMMM